MRLPSSSEPGKLRSVGVTQLGVLKRCPYQFGLAAIPNYRPLIVKGPPARLGTAAHQVLEEIALGELDGVHEADFDRAFEELWLRCTRVQEEEASQCLLERHFGSAAGWPGYQLLRARLRRRAQLIFRQRKAQISWVKGQLPQGRGGVEHSFQGFGGRLTGRVDRIVERAEGVELEDYKSGAIFRQDERDGQVVEPAYVEQLLLYAALYHEAKGVWPTKGHLISLREGEVSVVIEPDICLARVAEALEQLEFYNRMIEARNLAALARPSNDNCLRCPFKAVCDAFWGSVTDGWELGKEGFLRGWVVAAYPTAEGTMAITINVERGNLALGVWRLTGLDIARFPEASELRSGDFITVLRARISTTGSHDPWLLAVSPYTQLWQVELS